MEIKFKQGDRITIPEGCKATIDGNEVVIEKKDIKFKDGDILTSKSGFLRCPFIFKGYDDKGFYKFYAGMACGETLAVCRGDNERWGNSDPSYATEEEKQLLFDKLKEQGLRWNAEEKRVEKIRWRAEERKIYYYVSNDMNVSSTCRPKKGEHLYDYEGKSYLSYNYFRTKGQAVEAARRIKEVLRKYHEEIGE